MADKDRTIEILQHTISYWYETDQEMSESEQEHVNDMIQDGYNQGELNDNNENRGWWKMEALRIREAEQTREYRKQQFQGARAVRSEPYKPRIKVSWPNGETNWLSIEEIELQKIIDILIN